MGALDRIVTSNLGPVCRKELTDRLNVEMIYQQRFRKYCAIRGITNIHAIDELIKLHRRKTNVNAWISKIIGVDHDAFVMKMRMMGASELWLR